MIFGSQFQSIAGPIWHKYQIRIDWSAQYLDVDLLLNIFIEVVDNQVEEVVGHPANSKEEGQHQQSAGNSSTTVE